MRVVIIGAGIAGLAAAHTLRDHGLNPTILEAAPRAGGLLCTDEIGGFCFDRAGHFLHTRNPETQWLLAKSDTAFRKHRRSSAVVLDGNIIPYPLQFNLWAIAKADREKILRELAEADRDHPAQTFAEFVVRSWGPTLSELFFRPYNEKLWGVPLERLPADCQGKYLPPLSLDLVRKGAQSPVLDFGYNATFDYPVSGRIGDFAAALAKPLTKNLHLNAPVRRIDMRARKCVTPAGEFPFDYVISTVPLPQTLALMGEPVADPDLFRSANIVNIRVGFAGRALRSEQWYYIPDKSLPYYRILLPTNISNSAAPPGMSILSIEATIQSDLTPDALARQALEDMARAGVIAWSSVEVVDVCRIAPAYVVNRAEHSAKIGALKRALQQQNIFPAGRFGEWDYLSIDQAARSGVVAARDALSRVGQMTGAIARE